MKINGLLIGTASLFVATTGAQAADPVVVIEPTSANYVEVCDTFGAGFFYIPGTETCLQISGYVRAEADFGGIATGSTTDGDWNAYAKTNIAVVSKTETELGTLTGNITPEFYYYSNDNDGASQLDQAYIDIGDAFAMRVGYFKGYWNEDLYGELDTIDNTSRYNSVRLGYYGANHFQAAISLDALPTDYTKTSEAKLGISARLGWVASDSQYIKLDLAYDTHSENYAIRPWAGFAVGPGVFEIAGLYTNGAISYAPTFTASNWNDSPLAGTSLQYAVAANYYFTIAEKLTLVPQAQYTVASNDKAFWTAGATADWKVVDNFHVRMNANYAFLDDDWKQQNWFGWLRLERDF